MLYISSLYINYHAGFQLESFIGLLTNHLHRIDFLSHKLATLFSYLSLVMTGITIYLTQQVHDLPQPPKNICINFKSFYNQFFVSRFRSLFYKKIINLLILVGFFKILLMLYF